MKTLRFLNNFVLVGFSITNPNTNQGISSFQFIDFQTLKYLMEKKSNFICKIQF